MYTIKVEKSEGRDGTGFYIQLFLDGVLVDIWEEFSPVKVAFKVRELVEERL